jgi:tetratricopeptide (TPR) repeat protein
MKVTGFLVVGVAALVAAGGGWAQEWDTDAADAFMEAAEQDDEDPAEEAYQEGNDAIGDEEWDRALRQFDRVIALSGRRVDAALYWKAYALQQLGRRAEALAAIAELRTKAAKSRWLDDAKALEIELQKGSGRPPDVDADDEEMKLIAINSLMNTDPEQAVPMLEKVLAGGASVKLKKKALFVLSQSGSPRARQVVTDIARGNGSPQLQDEAVKYLGLFGGEASRQALADIYSSTSDPAVKKQVLQSFMLSGDKPRVLAAAKGEKDAALRDAAVKLLGVMGARAELAEMYRAESSPAVRKQIVHALFLTGSVETLADILKSERDPEVREQAIHSLGLVGGEQSGRLLVATYKAEASPELRKRVMHALFLSGNSGALVEIAKTERDAELRKAAVHWLSLMGSKESRDFMMEILEK